MQEKFTSKIEKHQKSLQNVYFYAEKVYIFEEKVYIFKKKVYIFDKSLHHLSEKCKKVY